MLKKFLLVFLKNKKLLALIIVGSLTWSATMVKSGLVYPYGMGFWGPNGHDGVWHIALINSLSRGSFEMPIFSGEALKNYHIGFDLILAIIYRITFIPIHNLYFQIVPPILAFLTGVFVYKFVLVWRGSKSQAIWSTFFVYFGGSFGWVFNLIRSRELGGESMFWSQQAISSLINPPFALSCLLTILGLIFLIKYKKNPSNKLFFFTVTVFVIISLIKIYAIVLVLSSLFIAGIFEVLKEKRFYALKVFLVSGILSLILFLPFNKNSLSLLVYQPFWFLENMMGLSDRFNWPKYYDAMTAYKSGGNWIKAVPAYGLAFIIFWVGNMGTRIIKEVLIIKWIKNLRSLTYLEVYLASTVLLGGLYPMVFLQSGTPWNTIQFLYYSLFFSAILAGVSMGEFIERKSIVRRFVMSTAVVIITVPTTVGTLNQYLPNRPPAMVSLSELEALKFLSDQPMGVVLTYPFDRLAAIKAENKPPKPLYYYESTAYVSAFSGKSVYLEDEVNLDITQYNWRSRHNEVLNFLNSLDHKYVKDFLSINNITYVYWIKGQRARLGETQLGMERIYENSEVDIFKVTGS